MFLGVTNGAVLCDEGGSLAAPGWSGVKRSANKHSRHKPSPVLRRKLPFAESDNRLTCLGTTGPDWQQHSRVSNRLLLTNPGEDCSD